MTRTGDADECRGQVTRTSGNDGERQRRSNAEVIKTEEMYLPESPGAFWLPSVFLEQTCRQIEWGCLDGKSCGSVFQERLAGTTGATFGKDSRENPRR